MVSVDSKAKYEPKEKDMFLLYYESRTVVCMQRV